MYSGINIKILTFIEGLQKYLSIRVLVKRLGTGFTLEVQIYKNSHAVTVLRYQRGGQEFVSESLDNPSNISMSWGAPELIPTNRIVRGQI